MTDPVNHHINQPRAARSKHLYRTNPFEQGTPEGREAMATALEQGWTR